MPLSERELSQAFALTAPPALRDLLIQQVDFDCVRRCATLELFIAATNVRTGQAQMFRTHERSADAVIDFGLLAFVSQAVEIDGEAYWYGGYMWSRPLPSNR